MEKKLTNPLQTFSLTNLIVSVCLLGLHFYCSCYWLFDYWHLTSHLSTTLLVHLADTGLITGFTGRLIVVFFMVLALMGQDVGMSDWPLRKALKRIGVGAGLYFASVLVFVRYGDPVTTCCCYMLMMAGGWWMLWTGGRALAGLVRASMTREDPFGRREGGFPQEERKLEGDFSMHLQAEYTYKGESSISWINLVNPRRGILILGSPGSGKSRFIIEPLIRQWMQKGHPLLVYDFKYPALTNVVHDYFNRFRKQYAPTAGLFFINFGDPSRSHRCNLLEPSSLLYLSDALGASRTILLSINKTWIDRQGEFFVESPINFLGAIIWFLRKYEGGKYCTLPHAIELAQVTYSKLFTILSMEPEVRSLVNPFIEAYRNKTFEMLDGQISSAKIPLGRLASPELYYVLTGNDFSLMINDPAAPKVLCLGGDPTRQEALAPIISLYIDRINRLCNRPGRAPCAIFCDEFGTIRAYSMTTTIATGRSNNIVPVIAVQDLSQLRMQYSRDEADLFLNATANLLCGQVGGETAKWVSERFPRIQRERTSVSEGSDGRETVNRALYWEPTMTAAAVAGLSSGEFVGMVADDPGAAIELKAFHARILRKGVDEVAAAGDLPVVHEVNDEMVVEGLEKVKQEVVDLVAEALKTIQVNPGLVVK